MRPATRGGWVWSMVGPMSFARCVTRTVVAVVLAGSALLGCKTPPPFPLSRSAGTNCGDPCAVMQCPSG